MFILFTNYGANKFTLVNTCNKIATDYLPIDEMPIAPFVRANFTPGSNSGRLLLGTLDPARIVWTGSTRPTEADLIHLYL